MEPQYGYNPKIDRTHWAPGPWDEECDRVEWRDDPTGLPCLAVRHHRSHWCGYVAVLPGHPWHGPDQNPDPDVLVHGGLTYSGFCDGDICHVPQPGEPDHVYWLGFDCAHAQDYSPAGLTHFPGSQYRTLSYVQEECHSLAAQIMAAA